MSDDIKIKDLTKAYDVSKNYQKIVHIYISGKDELLPVNQYNLQYIRELTTLIDKSCLLSKKFSIIYRFIENSDSLSEDEKRRYIGNIFNLLKSIKKQRCFICDVKKRLLKYRIDSKELLYAIKYEIKSYTNRLNYLDNEILDSYIQFTEFYAYVNYLKENNISFSDDIEKFIPYSYDDLSVSQIYDEASYNYILHVNKVIKENNLIDNYNERKIKYEEFRDKKIHLIEKEKEEDNKRYLELCEEYLNIFAKKVYDYINTANSGELVENIQYEIFRGNLSSEYKKNNNRPLYIIIYTTLTKTEKYYNHFVASLDGKSTKSCMSAYLFKSKKEYKEVEKKLKEKPRCKYFILKIEEEHGHLICH